MIDHILCDVKGKGEKRKLPKRHLDFNNGNTNSYENCLNNQKRLKENVELNEIVTSIADVTVEVINDNAKKTEFKEKYAANKIVKKKRESLAKKKGGLNRFQF